MLDFTLKLKDEVFHEFEQRGSQSSRSPGMQTVIIANLLVDLHNSLKDAKPKDYTAIAAGL